jgi:hypothetical protein
MKFKFTIGNVVGSVLSVAGFITEHTDIIKAVLPPKVGGFILAAGAAILVFSHNMKPTDAQV